MKIVMIGGGAHRVLGILRSALAIPGVMDGGEIDLFDLNTVRAEAMGRMLLKTPEQKRSGCKISWSATLDEALVGADVVGVILPAMSARHFSDSTELSHRRGFISSDNVSPTGAICAVRIAPVLLDLARKMERLCPNAWLINFVNPTAVISGMINNHTRIRTLGVCQGFTNHLWDIPRLLGRDEEANSLQVQAAGVNHLSFILKGEWENQDLFEALRASVNSEWTPPVLQPWWSKDAKANIQTNIRKLARIWQEQGVLIFSTEPDGMAHLQYAEKLEEEKRDRLLGGDIALQLKQQAEDRERAEKEFHAVLNRELDEDFWENAWRDQPVFKRADEDIFVKIFSAISGTREVRIATSRLNNGAISGLPDRYAIESTHRMFRDEIHPDGPFEIPNNVRGLISGLAEHQTLLGDALAEGNPEKLAEALTSYPVEPHSSNLRALYKELLAANAEAISPTYLRASEYL